MSITEFKQKQTSLQKEIYILTNCVGNSKWRELLAAKKMLSMFYEMEK